MKKKYEAPKLFVDTFVPDTMIASVFFLAPGGGPKNGNAGNNQNCWGCNQEAGKPDASGQNACLGVGYPGC